MPFLPLMLDHLKSVPQLDLHVILANRYTNSSETFKSGSITYHFYPLFDADTFKHPPVMYHPLGIEHRNRHILGLLKTIKPDLVHVHGACFMEFSPVVPEIQKVYPTLVSITGFLRNASRKTHLNRMAIWFEERILRKIRHFGVRTSDMEQTIRELNPLAVLHEHPYLTPRPSLVKDNHGGDEPFDGIYFARLVRDKGIFDLLEAIKLVREDRPDSRYLLFGQGDVGAVSKVLHAADELGIRDAIDFRGYQSDMEVVYRAALGAKMCILPTYHDVVPGTIIESMRMKLPVISYAVGGIPELNRNETCVELVDVHDIEGLARTMLGLIENPEKRQHLANHAFEYAEKNFNQDDFADVMDGIYRSIMSDK